MVNKPFPPTGEAARGEQTSSKATSRGTIDFNQGFGPGHEGACSVPKKVPDDTLIKIEETQAALRDSIEQAKQLADDSARLIKKHRAEIAEAEPPNRAT